MERTQLPPFTSQFQCTLSIMFPKDIIVYPRRAALISCALRRPVAIIMPRREYAPLGSKRKSEELVSSLDS